MASPTRTRPRPPARARRRLWAVALALAVSGVAPAADAVEAACWAPPVSGVVVDPFRQPACPWCAGNRGLEYDTGAGGPVRSVAAGVVTFSGSVAGTTYVVVRLANGWRLTYGRLTGSQLRRGDRVVAGSSVGTVGGELFFGVRIGTRYVDPAPHLGRLVGRPRLIPVDGSAARPAPPRRLRCRE